MKYGNSNFLQVPREINDPLVRSKVSDAAISLYLMLKEYEHRYTNEDIDTFTKRIEDIAKDICWSVSKTKRALKELKDCRLIEQGYKRIRNTRHHISEFRLLL